MSTEEYRLDAPGFPGTSTAERRRRVILFHTALVLWMIGIGGFALLNPSVMRQPLVSISVIVATVLVFIGSVAWSLKTPVATTPFQPYSWSTVGTVTSTETLKYIGGRELLGHRVVSEHDYQTCDGCGAEFTLGVTEQTRRERVVCGFSLHTLHYEETHYCTECRDDVWPAEIDWPTVDLHNPENSTLEFDVDSTDATNEDESAAEAADE